MKITKDLDNLEDLKAEITSRSSVSAGYSGNPPNVSGKAGVAVRFAYGALGAPYVWAAEGPNGYDCSGLTLHAAASVGVKMPPQIPPATLTGAPTADAMPTARSLLTSSPPTSS